MKSSEINNLKESILTVVKSNKDIRVPEIYDELSKLGHIDREEIRSTFWDMCADGQLTLTTDWNIAIGDGYGLD